MARLRYLLLTVVQTLLRVLPFPCRTGLVKIGNPDRNSPVLLTCNFRLTVERVKRALEGIDAYLLIANSRGVNVWCAATGGLLTNHDVVSVLKTSGIAELAGHREVILPQLAATGVEGPVIHKKTGWRVIWGPVEARSIREFLRAGRQCEPAMRTVRFAWPQRTEMAVAWAFPISLLALALLPVWRDGVLPVAGLVWAMSFALFLSFPLYERRLRSGGKHMGFVFFDFGERGFAIIIWAAAFAAVIGYGLAVHELSWAYLLRWSVVSLIVIFLLGLDLMGSTPVYKSGLHEDRLLRIELEAERCKGAGFCAQVCPVNVFTIDEERRLATLPRAQNCVQCGACVVQCPFDALIFRSPTGGVVSPATLRRYRLNLLGHRLVDVGESPAERTR
jgi:NAD-dependent dihydropyrimidine dehydrogenase PreA subunit